MRNDCNHFDALIRSINRSRRKERGRLKNGARVALFGAFLGLSCPHGTSDAIAGNPYINVPEQMRLANEAAQLWWNSLTAEQKRLERGISSAYNRASQQGETIPVTARNVSAMMTHLDAHPEDEDFVERMRYHVRIQQVLNETNEKLECMRKNANWWMPPNMRNGPGCL